MSKQLFDELISEIQAGNVDTVNSKLNELTEEQIDALFGEVRSYKSIGPASNEKVVVASVSNLREVYLKKLITTTMVGFLFQMKDEYTVEEEDLTDPPRRQDFEEQFHHYNIPEDFDADSYYNIGVRKLFLAKFPTVDQKDLSVSDIEKELSDEDLLEVAADAKVQVEKLMKVETRLNESAYNDAIQLAINNQSMQEKAIINKFLNKLFKFDKNKHSREGAHPRNEDPERDSLEELKGTHPVYDNIPPADTHCRFNQYYNINYETMRKATQDIYSDKPDLEHAMIVYDVLDSQEEATKFINKYATSSKFDILSFQLNKWTLMGPFKENRERVDYFNRHNDIIKSILEQQESDNVLGEELMKKRVKSTKAKAEKIFGKDSPQFSEYKKLVGTDGDEQKDTVVEEISEDKLKVTRNVVIDAASGEELKLDNDGVPTNALEVPVTTINAKTGKIAQTRIFTKAEDK